ncbi:MAG: SprT family zinc-dependent metalloprotease [Bacteroidales bacterium]|nr:M48 family metallopeptidase [Lentimicrobiaceae bacterium]MDD5695610.1 SprT family zinc-dependent metalloprotease [Bacteroidales bacterium]
MEYSVQYGKTKISYTLTRSNRKTLSIEVYPDLTVKVVAPLNASMDSIEEKLIKRGSWILKQWLYFESFLPRTPRREYISGETHLFLGRRYILKIRAGNKNEVKLKGNELIVLTKENTIHITARQLLARWYKSHSEKLFAKRLMENFKAFESFGLKLPDLEVKRMKRRWGSLTPGKKLIINPELIKAPVRCIDYVIIHELCHLVHLNHRKEFYQLQEKMMPDWKRWKDKLEIISA